MVFKTLSVGIKSVEEAAENRKNRESIYFRDHRLPLSTLSRKALLQHYLVFLSAGSELLEEAHSENCKPRLVVGFLMGRLEMELTLVGVELVTLAGAHFEDSSPQPRLEVGFLMGSLEMELSVVGVEPVVLKLAGAHFDDSIPRVPTLLF